jgi:hypothetical protein
MKTCEFCGKEEMLPHKCSYCGKSFCRLHMLPEKHECSSLPKDSPFWTQKREKEERQALRGLTHDICPKCHSEFIGCTSFDENDVNLVCQACWYRWTVPRHRLKTFNPQEVMKQIREQEEESKKRRRWFFQRS